MKSIIAKIVIAGLIMLQQAVFLVAPATVAASAVLLACSTPAERADTRQETRIEKRTEGRYERRRGED